MDTETGMIPQADISAVARAPAGLKRQRKSGSEQRLKQRKISFRVSDGEFGSVQVAADRAGVTVGTYVRDTVLGSPETRRRHRPSVEVVAVTRLQGEMNRLGGNLHQLLKRVNFGDTPMVHELQSALSGYKEVIASNLRVLGRGPSS